jgi:adenylate cyclase
MNESLLAYIPMDRRLAMARGETLADRTTGSALFADISGFTPLTEALVHELGPQRGAEELTGYLNQVYDALIDELHRWGGSAIAFAGDAVTCWFDGDDGVKTTACALAMQEAMGAFAAVATPAGSVVELSMKAAVAVGPARRFLVGNPQSRVIDSLAGATLERLAAGEHEGNRGEVILAPCAIEALKDQVTLREIREAKDGRQFGVLEQLLSNPQPPQLPVLAIENLREEDVRIWLLPPVYQRLTRGMGDFLAEIRPTVAVFMRFAGIDYDEDDEAGEKLDALIRAVQAIVDQYEGTLIDLNIGDKGSYLYVNFGAPLAHENNAARAASAALELRDLVQKFDFLEPVQIGISRGRMRAGAYGGRAHRTYGVLGDAVNLSARLMMASQPGMILVSMNVEEEIDDLFEWKIMEPIRVKGKSEPVPIAILQANKPRTGMHLPDSGESEPLIGRDREVQQLDQIIDKALSGEGQVVSFLGEAGLGKSRLVAKALNMAQKKGFTVFGGEAESHGVNSSYMVWHPIWRGIFGLDPSWNSDAQTTALSTKIRNLDPNMAQRVPLLGPAVQLAIKDNEVTGVLDAKLRKSLLESMLADALSASARQSPLLLILEDIHWIDQLSYDLLEIITGSIRSLPVVILLTFRDRERLARNRISSLPYFTNMTLTPLTEDDLTLLAQFRLEHLADNGRDPQTTMALARRIAQQAEGNPFYLEELVNYVGNEVGDILANQDIEDLELPTSLQSLVLSRLDQLPERPKTLLKVASVVGRVFHSSWLKGIYPELGDTPEILEYLGELSRQQFTVYDPTEGEDTYYFRNMITRTVIYDSLLYKSRTAIHEQTGQFLESAYKDETDQYLDLLAYHYDHGVNEDKKRYYLRRAGEFAQKSYNNQSAIEYFRKVLPLLQPEDQIEIMLKSGEVEQLIGNWNESSNLFQEALSLARSIGDVSAVGWSQAATGELQRLKGEYDRALQWFARARKAFEKVDERQGLAQVYHYSGNVALQRGDLDQAESLYEQGIALRREINDLDGIASLLNNMGIVAEFRGDFEAARSLHGEALSIRRQIDDPRAIAFSLGNLGHILRRMGNLAEARLRLEEAIGIQREIGDRPSLANLLDNLGNVVAAQGEFQEARSLYAESLMIMRDLKDVWETSQLLEDIARLLSQEKQHFDALVLLSAAGSLREAFDASWPEAEQAELDQFEQNIEKEVGFDLAKDCVKEGQSMSMDQAIAFANQTIRSRN